MLKFGRLRRGILGISICAFVVLSVAVETDSFLRIDQAVGSYAEHHVTRSGTAVMSLITQLGSAGTTLIITALILVFLATGRSEYWARRLLISVAGGMVSNEALKLSLHAVWLRFPHPAVRLAGSFPSGHALCATILYGFVTVFSNSYLDSKALRVLILAVSVVIVFVVSVSRIYLSAHYLSDVIGGVLEGIVWLNAVGIALDMKQVTATAPALPGNSKR